MCISSYYRSLTSAMEASAVWPFVKFSFTEFVRNNIGRNAPKRHWEETEIEIMGSGENWMDPDGEIINIIFKVEQRKNLVQKLGIRKTLLLSPSPIPLFSSGDLPV